MTFALVLLQNVRTGQPPLSMAADVFYGQTLMQQAIKFSNVMHHTWKKNETESQFNFD